jgi:hypothetical protein
MSVPYIINAALVLGACLAFYKVLLRRETFYKVNRYLLLACLAIAFALPLLQVPAKLSLRKKAAESGSSVVSRESSIVNGESKNTNAVPVTTTNTSPTRTEGTSNQQPAAKSQEPSSVIQSEAKDSPTEFPFNLLKSWIFGIYWFGVVVFGASFLFQLGLLVWRSFRNPVIIDGQYRIVEISGDKAPCSFGNTIYINPAKYDWDTYQQIILHEKVHIRERHTLDILFAELVLIFQWFNPFAWIYRREIESNLEFLTDDQLVQHSAIDKKSYQLSLVKVSAPHMPLSLTTNYNQSILKKRIAMMNRKRSNLHTGWKYFFLLPVLAFLAALLNEPAAKSQKPSPAQNESSKQHRTLETEGYWFAIIKDEKVNIRFSDEKIEDDSFDMKSGHTFSGNTFKLSELGTLPKGELGTFYITREAGKMEMTGKFEGNTGMGKYKFIADKAYVDDMSAELKEKLDEEDQLAFFFINIKKEYLGMLKHEGFTKISKDDIIPMAAMNIDAAYIKSIKENGFNEVTMEELIPLKALGVDDKYIKEIRGAGYKNVTTDQLVTFKSQGIDKDYITKVRQMKGKDGKDTDDDADDIVTYKSMGIDEAFINSFKAVGYNNIPHDELVSFKALGVTPEFIKGWQNAGFKDLSAEDLVGMKAQNVTPEYMKSFTDMGYKSLKPEDLVAFRALNITPEFIKSFEAAGYKDIDLDNMTAFKALGITPEYIKSFESVGFKNIDLDEITSVKALGVTPEYIKDMRAKGFNYDKLQKYVTLKSID